MYRIIFISDTHTLHDKLNLSGGDLLIHSGDLSSRGRQDEVTKFVYWFQNLKGFDTKIFIPGNHDMTFEMIPKPDWLQHLLLEENLSQSDCVYLEDSEVVIDGVKIYGTPWQPEFYNWAFNLPRSGKKLKEKWDMIPIDTDILITHCPPKGILDKSGPPHNEPLLGCELLLERVREVKPKIHIFGHIHGGRNIMEYNGTLFINASVLNEQYVYKNKPIVIDYNFKNNKWKVIDM